METGTNGYHGGLSRGSFEDQRDRDLKVFQELSVDAGLKEAVEAFAMREAAAPRKRDGVQQQVHQLLALQRSNAALSLTYSICSDAC